MGKFLYNIKNQPLYTAMTQTILSSNGIHHLHHTFFVPTGDICATLLIVHGMSEHSGRYEKFAQFLANHGVLVATYDQLGHGQTVKDKYELGFFDEKHPVQTLCKDVIIMADKLKDKAPAVPHFIMGHSMGSFLVRTVLTHHATSFDGVILMGTSNTYNWLNKTTLSVLTLANFYRPKHHNQTAAYLMNQFLLNKLSAPISASHFAWLSEDLQSIEQFENDSLAGFVFSNNGFFALQKLLQKACNPRWHAHLPKTLPMLLISGKNDPVGNMGQDIEDLHDELLAHGKTRVTSLIYPNMRHEPLHEAQKQRVYEDILRFIWQACL